MMWYQFRSIIDSSTRVAHPVGKWTRCEIHSTPIMLGGILPCSRGPKRIIAALTGIRFLSREVIHVARVGLTCFSPVILYGMTRMYTFPTRHSYDMDQSYMFFTRHENGVSLTFIFSTGVSFSRIKRAVSHMPFIPHKWTWMFLECH